MQIEVQIKSGCHEPRIVIYTDRMSEEVQALLTRLEAGQSQLLLGFRGEEATVLPPETLLRVYAQDGRVYAATEQGVFALRGPLYEWEQRLDPHAFVRISQSEIIHLRKVKGFDLSFSGTICVRLADGTVTYASRRYVSRIKTILGI